jgi:hypothetical protein
LKSRWSQTDILGGWPAACHGLAADRLPGFEPAMSNGPRFIVNAKLWFFLFLCPISLVFLARTGNA